MEVLRFPLILFVVYIHAAVFDVNYAGDSIALERSVGLVAAISALSGGIQRTAVPLLFLFAGYLFFVDFDGSVRAWRDKLRRRSGTLLLPYLLWNGAITALFLIGMALRWSAPYFNTEGQFAHVGPLGVFDAALGITRPPVVYPMWFVRNLMVLALLALPLRAVLVRTSWLLPAALILVWLWNAPFPPRSMVESTTFFVLGAALALRGGSLFAWEGRLWLFGPLCLLLFVGDLFLTLAYHGWWLRKPLIATGVLAALCLPQYALRHPNLRAALITLAPASFFVFAAHEPFMTLVRKLLYQLLPATPTVVISLYLLLPITIAASTAGLYFLIRRIAPRFAALASGNRLSARHAFRNINP